MRRPATTAVLLTLLSSHALAGSFDTGTGVPGNAAGDARAKDACPGFPKGTLKCLTDVSYVLCAGPDPQWEEVEVFVPKGSYCQQGIPGKMVDQLIPFAATTTRTYSQRPPNKPDYSVSLTSTAPPPPPPKPVTTRLVVATSTEKVYYTDVDSGAYVMTTVTSTQTIVEDVKRTIAVADAAGTGA